ncbi:major facilitator superfamily domain-containing protein [Desarmillaria tabescens]|uniref:Major facilitator superfamily domain-containing protein n=1 Tax=Armillaria tabescens TaxID=1929756 RepID=A0AA39NLK1_ARMTA|nr:major facilitator superfamily domain-containing protein [Desarmillaria tabescens]KAK0467810.1 major facilitator superfamily domain-containing protein [Desarmillaria tabescens]
MRSTDEISDNTIRETTLGNDKTEYDSNSVKTSTGLEDFPDGGLRAWLIIGGTMCSTFATVGFVNAWGVYQEYYEETLLKDSNPSTIAWIGSVQYALIFFPGLIVGHLFDIGYFRIPFILATILLVVSTFLIAECSQYWHFLLCQGFAIGLACGTIFSCVVGIVGHWFRRRRGIALGLTSAGAAVGSTVFPIVAHNLMKNIGFAWTMRAIACILVFSMGIANLTMRRRLPPANSSGGIFNLKAFTNTPYTLWCLSTFTAFLGIYTVLTYISVSATAYGVSPDIAFYLVSTVNASSGIGRIIAGTCADRFRALDFFGPMTIIAGALTYAWPFARTVTSMIVVAVIYGFSSGAYVSSFLIPVFELGDISDAGRRTGMTMSIAALGAVAGPPISGAINTATGGFEAMGYYAGTTIMLAVIVMYIVRHLIVKTS